MKERPNYEVRVRHLVLDPAFGDQRGQVAEAVQRALEARLGGVVDEAAPRREGVGERIADAIAERISSSEGAS